MRVARIAGSVVSLLSVVLICASLGSAAQNKVYTNTVYGYQLEYPPDFAVKIVGSATVFSSRVEDKTFAFSPSINVVAVDLAGSPADLDKFYQQSRDALERSLGSVKFLEDKAEKFAGVSARKLVYVSRQKKADFKFQQILCIRNNRAYVLTYTALQEQFDKTAKTAQAMIQSFQFTTQ
jgi:eukaryotic-like serine/threonine-protein kinase